MGNDGGTKALQRKYTRWGTKKEVSHYETDEEIQGKWSCCALTGEALQEPICACRLGYIFNKETIIQGIIEKNLPEEFSHIRKLKDVVDLHLTVNPGYESRYTGNAHNYWQQDVLGGKFICPITNETIGGKSRFCYLRTCGCVVAEKALKEIHTDECLVCGKKFTEDDVVLLNPSDEERKGMREKLQAHKHHHSEKKSVKRSRDAKDDKKDDGKERKLEGKMEGGEK